MIPGYDILAPIYDPLAGAFFGSSIKRSQQAHLDRISPHSKVLIVGGGTGGLLECLPTHSLEVTYLDQSKGMVKLAQKRAKSAEVDFIHARLEDFAPTRKYSIIITQFFLDGFEGKALVSIVKKLTDLLQPGGYWIVADFEQPKQKQHAFLLRLMYWFFRSLCRIEADRLEDFQTQILNDGPFSLISSQHFHQGFIFSALYQKRSEPLETFRQ